MNDLKGIPEQWQEYRESIWHEIMRLGHSDNMFWQIQAILQANPNALQDGGMSDWMAQCYSDSSVMGVRRLCDRTRGTKSLWHLLTMMAKNSTLLSKERYLGMHPGFLKEHAEEWWTNLAGIDCDHIPKAKINEVKTRLEESLEKISRFANQAVAHSGTPSSDTAPVWHDLRVSLCEAFECYSWVSRVLDSSDPVGAVPSYQGDWLKDLRVPWLPEGKGTPDYEHLDTVLEEVRSNQGNV